MNLQTYVILTRIEKKIDALVMESAQIAVQVKSLATQLTTTGAQMSQELDDLQAQVTVINSVQDSAIALLNGLSAQLADAMDDPAQVLAIAQALSSKSAELAAAVVANTPAPPAP